MHAKFLLTAAFAVASYASPIVEARAAAKNTYKTVLADIATIVKDSMFPSFVVVIHLRTVFADGI